MLSAITVKSPIGTKSIGATTTARKSLVVQARPSKGRGGPMGFVEEDNSGRANIFAVEPKSLYVSSPRSAKAASQGLGGNQGLLLTGGLVGVVALVTLLLAFSGNVGDADFSLREIAGNL